MTNDTLSAQGLLTVDELATRLRVPRSWVYSHSDDLGAYRLGKYLRFNWERVLERVSKLGQQLNDPTQESLGSGAYDVPRKKYGEQKRP